MTYEELVEQVNKVVPGKLRSAILYGSAVAGDFVPETSNYNVLLVIDGLGRAELDALSTVVAQWTGAGHRPPLLFTPGQLQNSTDIFAIELLDMQQSHRVLFGEDPLASMTIKEEHLRLQLECELNEKILALREGYLLTSGKPERVAQLMAASVTGMLVLFRAALRLFQKEIPSGKADSLRLLSQHIPFDPQPLLDAHDLKHRRIPKGPASPATLFDSYLRVIEQVSTAVNCHPQAEG
jgi:hypothetical protein